MAGSGSAAGSAFVARFAINPRAPAKAAPPAVPPSAKAFAAAFDPFSFSLFGATSSITGAGARRLAIGAPSAAP